MTYYLVLLDREEYVEKYGLHDHSVTVTYTRNDAKRFVSRNDAEWVSDRVAGFIETVTNANTKTEEER